MATHDSTTLVSATARWDRPAVSTGHGESYLVVTIMTGKPQERTRRPAVDVAFVIDRSGSMSGTPLALAKPGVATLAVFTFISSWDDLLWPMIIAPNPNMRTVQVGLAFIRQTAMTPDQVLAAIVVVSIPVIIAFLLGQRYFVSGITAGAVKE